MMYIAVLAWAYVVLMMAVAEATSPSGTLLGAFFTLLLYGVLPLAILVYLMGTPARRARRVALEQAQAASTAMSPPSDTPDTSRHAPTDAVAPVREKP